MDLGSDETELLSFSWTSKRLSCVASESVDSSVFLFTTNKALSPSKLVTPVRFQSPAPAILPVQLLSLVPWEHCWPACR
jgi:hypothetical protein